MDQPKSISAVSTPIKRKPLISSEETSDDAPDLPEKKKRYTKTKRRDGN